MNPVSEVTKVRREVLVEVAKWAWQGEDKARLQEISKKVIPPGNPRYRCCIHKERAIIEERVNLAVAENLGQVVQVIKEACNGCRLDKYVVTDGCQNCLAHSCANNCPKQAIIFMQNRAFIDQNRCVECGICARNCAFHAIIEISRPCERSCGVGAITVGEGRLATIHADKCTDCGACVESCPFGAVSDTSQIVPAIRSLRSKEQYKVAMLAPAIAGQFGHKVKMSTIKAGLLQIGFDEVVEVAKGADLTARAEGEELLHVLSEGQSVLATSCCPAWVSAVEKCAPDLKAYVSTTPSPMEMVARIMKDEKRDSCTIFIGPCIAKKAEGAKSANVDMVLTFEELAAVFEAAELDLTTFDGEAIINDGSVLGRSFPKVGGVAKAVLANFSEAELAQVRPLNLQGLKECIQGLRVAAGGKSDINFMECMACKAGCISGPGVLVTPNAAGRAVDTFAREIPENTVVTVRK